jgi:hypothetical protein
MDTPAAPHNPSPFLMDRYDSAHMTMNQFGESDDFVGLDVGGSFIQENVVTCSIRAFLPPYF